MGEAFLVGGGAGGGVRNKPISAANYEKLSESDKLNPYVIWVITDKDASNLGAIVSGEPVTTKVCVWSVYQSLSVDDKMDPRTVWIISDKSPKDLADLGYGATQGQGSQLYDITGELDLHKVKKAVIELTERVNEITKVLNGISVILEKTQGND